MQPSTSTPDPPDHAIVQLRARGTSEIAPAAVDLNDLNSPHTLAVLSVPAGTTVLDVGCGPGVVSRALAARGCQVWGIEIDARKAALARAHCVEVAEADLEAVTLPALFGGRRFDTILCLDVLEHLRAPEPVLMDLTSLLAPGGSIVISVPNVTHGALRLELLRGRFTYRRSGLLDRGHLRFFDAAALQDLVRQAGLRAETTLRVIKRLDQTEFEIDLNSIPPELRDQLESDPDALTYQFFVVARPLQGSVASDVVSLPERLRARVDEVTAELEKTGAYARHLEAELAAKDAELNRQAARAAHVEQVTSELESAGAYARKLEAELRSRDQQLRDAESLSAQLAEARAELGRATETLARLDAAVAAKGVELRMRVTETERLARALAEADARSRQLEEAVALIESRAADSDSRAESLATTLEQLREEFERAQARTGELEQMSMDLRRLLDDHTAYGRHLEQELQRRAREITVRDDQLSVARAHIEKVERTVAARTEHVAELEAYARHLESEQQARVRDLAERDAALATLREALPAAANELAATRQALAGQQALAARLSVVMQLPRHRLATAWGDGLIRRLPWLHRLLRPAALAAARRWAGTADRS